MDFKNFTKGFIKENPTFVQILGMCPTLAVTSAVINGIGMGLATTFVLVGSGIIVSLFRKSIPNKVRIPVFIVIIATFVTITELLMQAYYLPLYKSLGIFVPLIVVNCIILGRAEAFASKNGVLDSIMDALGMGLGFTGSLMLIAIIREFFGNGSILGLHLMNFKTLFFILPPGAFLTIGFLLAFFNYIGKKKEKYYA